MEQGTCFQNKLGRPNKQDNTDAGIAAPLIDR
jgi:hypothetical protein